MNRSQHRSCAAGGRSAATSAISLALLLTLAPAEIAGAAAAHARTPTHHCAARSARGATPRCRATPPAGPRSASRARARISATRSPVPLASAADFAVMAGSGITNTGPTTLGGDVGTFPTTTMSGTATLTVNGTNHGGDAVMQQAKADWGPAYDNAASQGPSSPIVADLGGQALKPGVYNSGSSIGLTGALTLDGGGDPSAVFIFQAGSTLTTASASSVRLINGAQSCNVFWKVGSSATLGTGSTFRGTILALTSVTVTHDVIIDGRALAANGAVTLDTDRITKPTCAAAGATTGGGAPGGGTTTGTTGTTTGGTTGTPGGTTGTPGGTTGTPGGSTGTPGGTTGTPGGTTGTPGGSTGTPGGTTGTPGGSTGTPGGTTGTPGGTTGTPGGTTGTTGSTTASTGTTGSVGASSGGPGQTTGTAGAGTGAGSPGAGGRSSVAAPSSKPAAGSSGAGTGRAPTRGTTPTHGAAGKHAVGRLTQRKHRRRVFARRPVSPGLKPAAFTG